MNEETLFHLALQKPAEQRTAFLAEACRDNGALRLRVQALLDAHENPGSFLQQPAVNGLAVADTQPDPLTDEDHASRAQDGAPEPRPAGERPGNRVGPYQLLQLIGEGGMGTVFLAEQTQPVQRQVALKIIKPGMDSRQVIARFEAERQALALMDHPNIAKVHDAGAAADGRPFFVMELVKGVPITRYCDECRLTPRQRLELFVPVCQAVQHAHQKGIIHRDLKPSNVLVARYDDRPVPKVIDFGVAKATGQQLTERTLHTGFGAVVGTVEYMSPEQASFNQLDVDTRSDVYSLGVLLYELLTGGPPFSRKELEKAGLLEVLRVIREQEPPKPSTRLSTADGLPTLAANRGTEPKKLCVLVRGELDWIVMKALEKDRNRRYETANGLALDVQRYLADEPVQACPPSAGYRLRKFVHRNKGPVLAVLLVLLALVGGIIGTTCGLVRSLHAEAEARDSARNAQDEQAKAERERDRAIKAEAGAKVQRDKAVEAEREAKEAGADTRAFSQFLVEGILETARPAGERGGLGKDVTVRTALGAAVLKLPEMFKDRPRAEAVARHALGVTYRLIGEPAWAEPHLRRAVELRRQTLGPDHAYTLNSQNSLGVLLNELGQTDEAVRLHTETLALQRSKLGSHHRDTLASMGNLASAYEVAGRNSEALSLHEETLALRKAHLGPDHPDTLSSMNNVALAYMNAARLPEALPMFEDARQRLQATVGLDHPETIRVLLNLGVAYMRAGRVPEAIAVLEEAVQRGKAQQGPDHPEMLTRLIHLAQAYEKAGQADMALPLLEEILAKRRAAPGPDHAVTLSTINALALGYDATRQFEKAEPLWRELLERWRRKDAPKPEAIASLLSTLGLNLVNQAKHAEAEPFLREALPLFEKTWPEGWQRFHTQSVLGASLRGQKNYAAAEPLLLQGYEGLKQRELKVPKDRQRFLTEALERLVQLYDAWGQPEKAADWRKKLEAQKEESGTRSPRRS